MKVMDDGAGDLEFLVWLFSCCPAAFCCWRERALFLKQNNNNKKPYQLRNLDQFGFNLVFYFSLTTGYMLATSFLCMQKLIAFTVSFICPLIS